MFLVQARIKGPWFVRGWFHHPAVAASVWYREGCVWTQVLEELHRYISKHHPLPRKWQGALVVFRSWYVLLLHLMTARNISKGFFFFFQTKVIRVLNLWQKSHVFELDIIQPLMDMANGPVDPAPALEGKQTSLVLNNNYAFNEQCGEWVVAWLGYGPFSVEFTRSSGSVLVFFVTSTVQ